MLLTLAIAMTPTMALSEALANMTLASNTYHIAAALQGAPQLGLHTDKYCGTAQNILCCWTTHMVQMQHFCAPLQSWSSEFSCFPLESLSQRTVNLGVHAVENEE